MPSRNFSQYFIVTLKGLAMGAADVVPGVSGGTIAFISGIYEELVSTIDNLNLSIFKRWKNDGFKATWIHYNFGFLTALLLGILISILSLASLIKWLLLTQPIAIWSFFFGLILASILLVGKQITTWKLWSILAMILAALLSYYITIIEPMGSTGNNWFLFFAGFVAIIAMILPGLSGAFILLLLGAYPTVIGALTQFLEGIMTLDWSMGSSAFLKLSIFGIGAIIGIKAFSGVLNWMFKHHKNLVLAVLTGFMIGALNKIWPWKEVLQYRVNGHGENVPFLENSMLPSSYIEDPQLVTAVIFAVLGFLIIYILERISLAKK